VAGATVLTKYTGWIVVSVAGFFLVARWLLVERAPALSVARRAGLAALVVLTLAGWFYARNWIHFGKPMAMNTEALGDVGWWMQPGFHTASYYTSFGEVLRHPFFSGFASFWDGVYSTFWGDGLVAGMVHITTRHPFWNYEAMTLVYWVALPASVLIALGFVLAVRDSAREQDPGRRAALAMISSLVFLFGLALLAITLQVPYYAQAKAFYALGAVVPLSVLAGRGLAAPIEWLAGPDMALPRALYGGWLGLLVGLLVLSFLG